MPHKPISQFINAHVEPHTVCHRPGVDAAIDLTVPIRPALVLPATVLREQFCGTTLPQNTGIETPLTQGVERPGRCRPGLRTLFCCFGSREVEFCRKKPHPPIGRLDPAMKAGVHQILW